MHKHGGFIENFHLVQSPEFIPRPLVNPFTSMDDERASFRCGRARSLHIAAKNHGMAPTIVLNYPDSGILLFREPATVDCDGRPL